MTSCNISPTPINNYTQLTWHTDTNQNPAAELPISLSSTLQKTRHFQRTNLNRYLPKMLQSKKLTTKISSQTEFTMSRRDVSRIITSSEPHCKNFVVLCHPPEFIDMSPKSLQLKPHCSFPDINCLSNSTQSTNVILVGDFIFGINSQFYNYTGSSDERKSVLINGLSKNSHTMYSNSLAVYRVQTVDDNYNYSL